MQKDKFIHLYYEVFLDGPLSLGIVCFSEAGLKELFKYFNERTLFNPRDLKILKTEAGGDAFPLVLKIYKGGIVEGKYLSNTDVRTLAEFKEWFKRSTDVSLISEEKFWQQASKILDSECKTFLITEA